MEVHNVSSTFNKDWYSDKAKIIKQDENFMIMGVKGKELLQVTRFLMVFNSLFWTLIQT